jgi:MYXO-CTERM domain-containing protein
VTVAPPRSEQQTLRWARALTLVLVATVPVLSGVKRGLPVPGFRLSELLTVVLGGVVFVACGRRSLGRPGVLDWLALAYVIATLVLGAIDLLHRDAPFDSDNLSGLLGPFQFLVLYRAVAVTSTTDAVRRDVLRALLLASVPVALLAILQSLGIDAFVNFGVHLTGSDYRGVFTDQGFVRATGTFPHWQVAAGYFLTIGVLGFALLMRPGHDVLGDRVLLAVVALDIVALLRTVTTGASTALAVTCVLLAVASGRLRNPLAWPPVIVLVVLVIGGSVFAPRYREQYQPVDRGPQAHGIVPRTIVYRYDIWKDQYLPVLEHRWVAGFGPDIPPDARWKYTESVYVTMLLRGGVLLLAIYLAFMVRLAIEGRRLMRDGPPLHVGIGSAAVAIVLVLAVTQIIATYFTTSGAPQVVWALAALVAAAGLQRRERPV